MTPGFYEVQIVEKYRQKKNLCTAFIDLNRAYARVPRKVLIQAIMRNRVIKLYSLEYMYKNSNNTRIRG